MRKVFDVEGYANIDTCTFFTSKKLDKLGLLDEVTWLPTVTKNGRIAPVAFNYPNHLMALLAQNGICVI